MPRIRTGALPPAIGALVENVDLAGPLDEEEFADIQAALLKHQVIFFENQRLKPAQHRDFAPRFGALHTHPLYPGAPEAPAALSPHSQRRDHLPCHLWRTYSLELASRVPNGSVQNLGRAGSDCGDLGASDETVGTACGSGWHIHVVVVSGP